MKVGVLALQGAFIEHIFMLHRLGVEAVEVRLPRHLDGLDGLVVPGGESTSISKLLCDYGLVKPMHDLADRGVPVLGTCAGMVVLARDVDNLPYTPLGLIDIAVKRNAFGRQVDSFETDLDIPAVGNAPFHGVFIRAPMITRLGAGVETLCSLGNGEVVAARQRNIVVLAFHPELTDDLRLHSYFIKLAGVGFAESNCR